MAGRQPLESPPQIRERPALGPVGDPRGIELREWLLAAHIRLGELIPPVLRPWHRVSPRTLATRSS
jgi:hypothetical protein